MAENIVPAGLNINIQQLLNEDKIANIYVNGFTLGHTLTDSHIVLLEHGQPKAIIQMSLTIAKTLSIALSNLVLSFEKTTNQSVKTLDELNISVPQDAKV